MSIKLVASDLDGTIIDKNNNISPKNFKAIEKIHQNNVKFAICTGKSYSVSHKLCKQFNATFGIFGNGNQIIDLKTGTELLRKTLSKDDLLFILTLAKRYNYHCHIYSDNEIISEKLEYMDLRNFKLKYKNSTNDLNFNIVKDILQYVEKKDINAFSIVVSSSENKLNSFKNILSTNNNIVCTYINKRGKYRDAIINKDYEYLNITSTNINKHHALEFLTNYLNISYNNVLAIGDNINDLEMVKNAGIGVAVNEAYDELKDVAKYVTKSTTTEGAFSEAIEKFI